MKRNIVLSCRILAQGARNSRSSIIYPDCRGPPFARAPSLTEGGYHIVPHLPPCVLKYLFCCLGVLISDGKGVNALSRSNILSVTRFIDNTDVLRPGSHRRYALVLEAGICEYPGTQPYHVRMHNQKRKFAAPALCRCRALPLPRSRAHPRRAGRGPGPNGTGPQTQDEITRRRAAWSGGG